MVDPNSIFLWNSTHYMLAYYNMIGKRTNKQVIKFPRDLPWRCDRYA